MIWIFNHDRKKNYGFHLVKNVLSRAARFGFSEEEAKDTVEQIRKNVSGWRKHFEDHGISGHDLDILEPSFEKHSEPKRAEIT